MLEAMMAEDKADAAADPLHAASTSAPGSTWATWTRRRTSPTTSRSASRRERVRRCYSRSSRTGCDDVGEGADVDVASCVEDLSGLISSEISALPVCFTEYFRFIEVLSACLYPTTQVDAAGVSPTPASSGHNTHRAGVGTERCSGNPK